MLLIDRLCADRTNFRKDRDNDRANILGCVIADAVALANKVEKRSPTDEECLKVIQKMVTSLDETIKVTNSYTDRIQRTVLQGYLPEKITGQNLENYILGYIMSDGDNVKLKDVMTYLAKTIPGQYDGKEASEIAKRFL